ncbi:MAG: tetratricopeptide repeat protein [Myxococcales bacterium]|nr:tetratricopeptide repeat protein [Myxococcales bacterium]
MASFEEHSEGSLRSLEQRDAIYQLVDHIGALAIPPLLRQLFVGPSAAQWATELLIRLADSEARVRRIAKAVVSELQTATLPEPCKLPVAELLGYLGEPIPWPEFSSAEDSAQHSLCDLAACIDSPAELARTADTLLADLPTTEVIEFVEDFATQEPAIAIALIDELLLRDTLHERSRAALRQLGVSVSVEHRSLTLSIGALHAPPKRPGLRLARHASGRSVLVAYARCKTKGPRQYRALSLHLESNGTLSQCEYLDQVPRSTVESLLLTPLAEAGYEISPAAPGALRQHAIFGCRLRIRGGQPMPRAYFLGRDLLGLSDEHMPRRSPRSRRRTQDAALLARGTELLSLGRAELARDLLIQYAKGHPRDSEALATLGSCLVQVGDIDRAREYLSKASSLAPQVGRYHWNLAALAHREGRSGECFLALKDYLACSDAGDASQRSVARELVASYGLQRTSLARNDERDDQNGSPSPRTRRK